jgi:hypothetical protein
MYHETIQNLSLKLCISINDGPRQHLLVGVIESNRGQYNGFSILKPKLTLRSHGRAI